MSVVGEKRDTVAVKFDDALEISGDGAYNVALAATSALILLAMGTDMFGFTLVVTMACDLHLTIIEKSILTSLPFIGILLVSYPWGYISDTKGRRFTLVLSLQVGFVLSCLASLSPNWIILALLKFLSICFTCAANSTTYTLVGESCSLRKRSKYLLLMTSLLIFTPAAAALLTYPVSKMHFELPIPWLNLVFSPWRLLNIVLALPLGIGAVAILFFHESPKFLANSGRDEEALLVLKSMHAVNYWRTKEEYTVTSLQKCADTSNKYGVTLKGIWEQCAPLFRPPLMRHTLKLFYIVAVVYMTNNSFLVWLPHIMRLLEGSVHQGRTMGNICQLMSTEPRHQSSNVTVENLTVIGIPSCSQVETSTLYTLFFTGILYSSLNLIISHLPNRRRVVLITVLSISALSGILINVTPEPISSTIFFVIFTSISLGMGILATYFVELYPTSYRGMVSCLSIMVGRTSSFLGINLIALVLFDYCDITFYVWSVLIISSAVAAWFLPADKPPQPDEQITKL